MQFLNEFASTAVIIRSGYCWGTTCKGNSVETSQAMSLASKAYIVRNAAGLDAEKDEVFELKNLSNAIIKINANSYLNLI